MSESRAEAHLAALQAADSLFPTGLYAHSFGLECFVEAGVVRTVDDLEAFAADLVVRQLAPVDGVAAACAHRAVTSGERATVVRADRLLDAAKPARSLREASRAGGRRVLDVAAVLPASAHAALTWYRSEVRSGGTSGHQAVASAVLGAAEGLDVERVTLGTLYAVTAAVAVAAVRLGLADHLDVQRLLARLRPTITRAATTAAATPLEEMGGWSPLADAGAVRHERATRRLFQT